MKVNRFIFGTFLINISQIAYAFTCGHAHFIPRSQTVNLARTTSENGDMIRYHFWAKPEYTRSFRSNAIANYLFGCTCSTLVFSGSRVTDRGKKDILADYFGLPSDFKSKVSFCPLIQNLLVDFGCTVNLDWLKEGLYFNSYAPLVHTRWDLRMNECVIDSGVNFSPAGYFSGGNLRLERDQLVKDVKTAFQGNATFGDMQNPLRFGKICGKQIATEVATIHAELGWNFCDENTRQGGVSLFVSAPTGTRTKAEYLFEPVIGNSHHWELGLGLHGWWDFWIDDTMNQRLRLFGRAHISHLFESLQRRSFDLKKNGCGSRYMFLTILDKPRYVDANGNTLLQVPEGLPATEQYTGHLIPAINKTTLDCRINTIVQADILIGFSYKRNNWELDFGYNLWIRSTERLQSRGQLEAGKFGVKGDAQVYGFWEPGGVLELSLPLNATQSRATICSGQANGNLNFANENADNAQFAYEIETPGDLNNLTLDDANDIPNVVQPDAVNGSSPPIMLGNYDIDEQSGLAPRASSSKLFVSCRRTVPGDEQWDTHFDAGFELEFGHTCCALSQFGFWVGFGIVY